MTNLNCPAGFSGLHWSQVARMSIAEDRSKPTPVYLAQVRLGPLMTLAFEVSHGRPGRAWIHSASESKETWARVISSDPPDGLRLTQWTDSSGRSEFYQIIYGKFLGALSIIYLDVGWIDPDRSFKNIIIPRPFTA